MKNLFFSLLILPVFLSKVLAMAGPEYDLLDGHLVHVTAHMSKGNRLIPGAALPATPQEGLSRETLINKELTPKSRFTLHHVYQGMVAEDALVAKTSVFGTDKARYAFIDSWRNFEGDLFGGEMCDVMTGVHVYGESSHVVLPSDEMTIFAAANPEYRGRIWTYVEGETLRDTVYKVLEQVSPTQLRFKYVKNPNAQGTSKTGWFKPVNYLTDSKVSTLSFDTYLQSRGLYVGPHATSPMRQLETCIIHLRLPFLLLDLESRQHPEGEEGSLNEGAYCLSTPTIENLLSLYNFTRQDVEKIIESRGETLKQQVRTFLDEKAPFIHLLRTELALRVDKKSLFYRNPAICAVIKNRREFDFEQIEPTLRELTPEDIRSFNGKMNPDYVPFYMQNFQSYDPHYFSELCRHSTLTPGQQVAFQLSSLFRLHWLNEELEDELVAAVRHAWEGSVSEGRDARFTNYVKGAFLEFAFKDESDHGGKILSLLNHPDLRELRHFLYPGYPLESNLDFNALIHAWEGYQLLSPDRLPSTLRAAKQEADDVVARLEQNPLFALFLSMTR